MNDAVPEIDQVLESCIALGILLEDLADDRDRVGVNAENDWSEGFPLLQDESIFAQRMGCLEKRFYPFRGRGRLLDSLGKCIESIRLLALG